MPQKEVVEWLNAKTLLNHAEERLKTQVRSIERLTPLLKNWRTLAPAAMGTTEIFDALSWPDSALLNDTPRECHEHQQAFDAAETALTSDDRQAVEKSDSAANLARCCLCEPSPRRTLPKRRYR